MKKVAEKVAVVIPIYKDELNDFEKISLTQVQKVLGNYPIIFFAPEGKIFSYVPEERQIIYFPAECFKNIWNYNALMLEKDFYANFFEFDYILLYQLDAFVFSDKLEYFCSLGYDYIGAAWPYFFGTLGRVNPNIENKKIILRAGNGGFCLRNVKAFYNLLEKQQTLAEKWHDFSEDNFFAYCGAKPEFNFKNAPVNVANKFSAEFHPARVVRKNGGELPFGCHAWYRYSADFYFEVFKKFGYDLTPYKNKMLNHDFDALNTWKKKVVENRLQQKIRRGENISKYLQKNFYFAIYFLEDPRSKNILDKILAEDKITYNKMFQYKINEAAEFISDLSKAKKNVLVITTQINDDLLIISEFQKNKLKLKSNIEFFQLEHLKFCEKIFDNLGK